MIPPRLEYGDEIRVIAPSGSLSRVRTDIYDHALSHLQAQGFKVSFSKNSREMNEFQSSEIRSRVDDIHEAFADKNVKMVITCIGGFNVNQILPHLNYTLIKENPKILCGFSDITALLHAVYTKTGLVTYHGPHFCTFGFDREAEYTQSYFYDCVMNNKEISVKPSETSGKYYIIQEGECEGNILGGNLCTLNLLQGTPYIPELRDKILFIEDDNIMGDYFIFEFDRNLQSLLQVYGADSIRGIVFGRFDASCKLDADVIQKIIKDKVSPDIPVVFGVDFGHVFPMITYPIGGKVKISAKDKEIGITLFNLE